MGTRRVSERTQSPKRVIVVGAGMAGLVAELELQAAGHEPVDLEAQGRVGGRILTLREPFADGLYAEAGAMRTPLCHQLTMAYVERLGLRAFDFTMGNPRGYSFLHGQRHRIGDVEANPALLDFPFAEHERGRTFAQLWADALAPLLKRLAEHPESAQDEIVASHDEYSTREFLEANNWSEGAIELFGLLADQEALMNSSFLELFREEAGNSQLHDDIVGSEGRVFFAGEHTSLCHAWIQGAIESGLRAACEVHHLST